jgi:hypothetical protein
MKVEIEVGEKDRVKYIWTEEGRVFFDGIEVIINSTVPVEFRDVKSLRLEFSNDSLKIFIQKS